MKGAVASVALLFASFGCSNPTASPSTAASPSPTPSLSSCSSNANNTVANLMTRVWTSPCMTGQFGQMVDSIVFISSTAATETIQVYSSLDTSCTTLQALIVINANYTVGPAASVTGYDQISFTITSANATPETNVQAATWNSTVFGSGSSSETGFCGIPSWAAGSSIDVTGEDDPVSGCRFPTSSSLGQIFALGTQVTVQGSPGLSCTTPVNGAMFGLTNGYGILVAAPSTSFPSSTWGVVFNGL